MPRYNYHCPKHGDFLESRHVEDRKDPAKCPECECLSDYAPTFETQPPVFVGSGFYETDYNRKVNNAKEI
jgi:putative FmdB family regulatory protein